MGGGRFQNIGKRVFEGHIHKQNRASMGGKFHDHLPARPARFRRLGCDAESGDFFFSTGDGVKNRVSLGADAEPIGRIFDVTSRINFPGRCEDCGSHGIAGIRAISAFADFES